MAEPMHPLLTGKLRPKGKIVSAAAAVALTLSMAIKTGQKCLGSPVAIALFLAIFVLNGLFRTSLLHCLALLAPLSLLWGWPRNGKEAK